LKPSAALERAANPAGAAREQQQSMAQHGVAQLPREDLLPFIERGADPARAPAAVRAAIAANPEVGADLRDGASYDANGARGGSSPVEMKADGLHGALESAAGTPYGVQTRADVPFRGSDGTYVPGQVPFDGIHAAVDAGLPVPAMILNHEIVITGRYEGPDGEMHYVVRDPASGARKAYPQSRLAGGMGSPQAVTLPAS